MVLTKKKGPDLETQLLEVRRMSRHEFFLPRLTKLRLNTGVFERVYPPLDHKFQTTQFHLSGRRPLFKENLRFWAYVAST